MDEELPIALTLSSRLQIVNRIDIIHKFLVSNIISKDEGPSPLLQSLGKTWPVEAEKGKLFVQP